MNNQKVSFFFDKNTIFIRKYTSKRVKYKINEFIFIFEREYFDEVNIQTKFYTSAKVEGYFLNLVYCLPLEKGLDKNNR